MLKKALIVLAFVVILIVGWRYLEIRHDLKMEAQRSQDSNERDALITKVADACHAAIKSAVSPRQVLDFSHNYGPGGTDFGGYGETDTGYSYRVIADFGTEKVRLKCYMNSKFQILKVVKDSPSY